MSACRESSTTGTTTKEGAWVWVVGMLCSACRVPVSMFLSQSSFESATWAEAMQECLLGGSWVVMSRVRTFFRVLITPLIAICPPTMAENQAYSQPQALEALGYIEVVL